VCVYCTRISSFRKFLVGNLIISNIHRTLAFTSRSPPPLARRTSIWLRFIDNTARAKPSPVHSRPRAAINRLQWSGAAEDESGFVTSKSTTIHAAIALMLNWTWHSVQYHSKWRRVVETAAAPWRACHPMMMIMMTMMTMIQRMGKHSHNKTSGKWFSSTNLQIFGVDLNGQCEAIWSLKHREAFGNFFVGVWAAVAPTLAPRLILSCRSTLQILPSSISPAEHLSVIALNLCLELLTLNRLGQHLVHCSWYPVALVTVQRL